MGRLHRLMKLGRKTFGIPHSPLHEVTGKVSLCECARPKGDVRAG